jgi:hypothetical protein
MHSNATHTVPSIVSFLIETTVTARSSEYQSRLKDAQTLWMRLPACGQGCQIGFFEAKFQKSVFFLIWLASQNSIGLLAFSWRFRLLKLSARNLHTTLFLNHFLLRKKFFWSVTFGNISAAKNLGKEAPAAKR